MQSPALGPEGILDVLMQSAELLLIIGVAGAQGGRLLASWRQHQQAQECTIAHKHKVQRSTTLMPHRRTSCGQAGLLQGICRITAAPTDLTCQISG